MARFWISWYETTPDGDYRPLTLPISDDIKGWWCSGSTMDDRSTMCAVVDEESEAAAKALLGQFWNLGEWRFCDEQDLDWMPDEGRFPQ